MSSPKNGFFSRVKSKDYDHSIENIKKATMFNLKSRDSKHSSPNNFMKAFQQSNDNFDRLNLTNTSFYKTNNWESLINPMTKLQMSTQNHSKLCHNPVLTSSYGNVFDTMDSAKYNRVSSVENSKTNLRNHTTGVSKYLKNHENLFENDVNNFVSPKKVDVKKQSAD